MKLIIALALVVYLGEIECLTQAQIDECLSAHNKLRELMAKTPPLVWDDKLSQKAQKWAEHLIVLDKMQHMRPNTDGENIAYGKSYRGPRSCASAVKAWFDEIKDYDYNTGNTKDGHHIGHFTQVVWHDTKKVGVGIAQTKNKAGRITTYIVAEYSPKGNRIVMKWGESYKHARERTYSENKEVEPLSPSGLAKEPSLSELEGKTSKRTVKSEAVDLSDLDIYDDDVEVIREARPTEEDTETAKDAIEEQKDTDITELKDTIAKTEDEEKTESDDSSNSKPFVQDPWKQVTDRKREIQKELNSYHPRQLTIEEDPSIILDRTNKRKRELLIKDRKREFTAAQLASLEVEEEQDEYGVL